MLRNWMTLHISLFSRTRTAAWCPDHNVPKLPTVTLSLRAPDPCITNPPLFVTRSVIMKLPLHYLHPQTDTPLPINDAAG